MYIFLLLGLILGIFAHPSQSYCCRPQLWDCLFLQDSLISIIMPTGTRNIRGWLQGGYSVPALPGSADARAATDAVGPAQAAQETDFLACFGDSCQNFLVSPLPCSLHTFACLAWTSITQCESSHLERRGREAYIGMGVKFLEPQLKHRAAQLTNTGGNTVDVSNWGPPVYDVNLPFIFPWLNDLRHRRVHLAKGACSTSRVDTTCSLEPRSPLSALLSPPTASLRSAENEARAPHTTHALALDSTPSKVHVNL